MTKNAHAMKIRYRIPLISMGVLSLLGILFLPRFVPDFIEQKYMFRSQLCIIFIVISLSIMAMFVEKMSWQQMKMRAVNTASTLFVICLLLVVVFYTANTKDKGMDTGALFGLLDLAGLMFVGFVVKKVIKRKPPK